MAGSSASRRTSNQRQGSKRNKKQTVTLPFGIIVDRYTPAAMLLGVGAGLTVITLLSILIVGGSYGYFQLFNLILPRVSAGSVPLGGLSTEWAIIELEENWGGASFTLTDGETTWQVTSAEFGMGIDATATAWRAHAVGHGQGFADELVTLFNVTRQGYTVTPVVTLDEATARAGLERWAETIQQAPAEAAISIEGSQIVAIPGQAGYQLNVDATLQRLLNDTDAVLASGTLPLVLDPVQPDVLDASGAIAEAQGWLAAPLAIALYDPITDEQLMQQAAPEVIAAWLGVENGVDGPAIIVDEGRVEAYLDEVSGQLAGAFLDPVLNAAALESALRSGQSAELIVSHATTLYTVQAGDTLTSIAWDVGMPYWRILESNPTLDPDALIIGTQLIIPSKDDLLPLPVVASKRLVVSISDQRLWVYENGDMLHEYIISTGMDRSPTQPGIFQVQTHDINAYASVWDLTMPHFLGIYEAWPGFMNGFHGLPTLSSGNLLWADVLGRPASYGCIILNLDEAEWLYTWAEEGVVVEIQA